MQLVGLRSQNKGNEMNNNEKRTFWISVGVSLFAVFLLYSYTQEKSSELTKKFGAKERVVIANKEINEMETIDETMLQIVERPVDFIQPSAVSDPELAVGKVALAPIKKNEQILETKIMEPGPITGLSLQVSPGKRAIPIPVDEIRGVAKLLKPGDRIDIVTALDVGKGQNQRREVKTLMEDVVILATGLNIINEMPRLYEKQGNNEYIKNIRGNTNFSSVTVEVSPHQVQDLVYILSTSPGSLFLTLRHPSDRLSNLSRLRNTTAESLLGKPSPSLVNSQLKSRIPASLPIRKPKKVKKKRGPYRDL